MSFFYIPFIFQGGAMFVDEFYFHHKRRLPRWEKIGHPLDTLTVLLCYLFLILATPSQANIFIYSGLALFSCLFVTKDEFVHSKECSPGEHWLHAILFILHPLILGIAVWMWVNQIEKNFLIAQCILTVLFLFYQVIYWSLSHE